MTTIPKDKEFESTSINNGAEISVQRPNSPLESAEIIASGDGSSVLIIKPGQDKWECVLATKCYLQE